MESFVRYGKARIPLRLPDHAEILRAPDVSALPDPAQAIRAALDAPIGCSSLASMLEACNPRTVIITISDITRPVPNQDILPPIFDILERTCPSAEVRILVATGMHRSSTDDEKRRLVGEEILAKCQVIDHRSDARDELSALPRQTRFGTTAYVNSAYLNADFRIVTGFIEPHFMAGFSGGRKGVCPGLVNVETVQNFHGFKFLDSPNATNYVLEGNPLHEEAMDVVEMAGIDFLVNVAVTEEKKTAAVYAGDWQQAFDEGTAQVKAWTSAACSERKDVVISCAGGDPLDKTLYQTGKGMCSALAVLKDGGRAVIASACGEGLGSPSFSQIMRDWGSDWRGFIKEISAKEEVLHDQWGFQMHAKVLDRVGVEGLLFASRGIPAADQARMSLTPIAAESGEELEAVRVGMQAVIDSCQYSSIAIIPDGPYTVAVLKEG